ncbi:Fic family protein [Nocardioides nitrophenolicus]|uniref:Fic family protein n=1 Tax=Nocardioides nitrophenolicus TaxID=60489 RepID=UPI0019564636|nr:Fic family protein [Nocardioides nitrophenolicus]MBM7515761.1 Fic family protein [Nocardioides nitrophenolicus]
MSQERGGVQSGFVLGWEQHAWDRAPDLPASRRQSLAARGPYQAAVPAAIAGLDVRVDAALQAEAEDAVREITRFDAEVTALAERRAAQEGAAPVAEIAPLASVLLRTESASSSEIEGVTAGARALALAAIDAQAGPNARLVTANVTALRRAIELADAIDVEAILAAHEALLGPHAYAAPGRLRDQQVWIGSTARSPHTASFVPPHPSRVPAALDDLIAFVHRADLPALVQVAIAHAQFETIHPFNDGNGRTGRTLVHAMLRGAGVTRTLTVPVSAGLLTDTSAYFDALTDYRRGIVETIIRQFVDASFRAIGNGRRLIDDLEEVHQAWSDRLPSRRGSAARQLLPHLLSQPAVDVAYVQGATGVALSAAQRAVEQLEAAGILSRVGGGRRNRVWVAAEVIDALDAFAERVGRRG